jgi:hypothetical protein
MKSAGDVAKGAARPSVGRVLKEQQSGAGFDVGSGIPRKIVPVAPHQAQSSKLQAAGQQQKVADWQEAGAVAANQLQEAIESGDVAAFAAAAAAAADAAAGSGSGGFTTSAEEKLLGPVAVKSITPGSHEEAEVRAAKGVQLQKTLEEATSRHEQAKAKRRQQQYDRDRRKMDVKNACRFMTYPAAENGTTSTMGESGNDEWYRPIESDLEQQIKLVEASVEKMRLTQRSRESKLRGWAARLSLPEPALPSIRPVY